jgi:excisionase family DNA binding protein
MEGGASLQNNPQNPEELLSANDAGKLLGVSGKTIIRMLIDGNFAGYKIGSYYKFKRSDIIQYRETRRIDRGKPDLLENAA